MSTDVAAQEVLPQDSTFHLDAGIEDPEEFLAVHELMNRGQLPNAYEVRRPGEPHIRSIHCSMHQIRPLSPDPIARAPPCALLPVALFGGWIEII